MRNSRLLSNLQGKRSSVATGRSCMTHSDVSLLAATVKWRRTADRSAGVNGVWHQKLHIVLVRSSTIMPPTALV